MPTEASQTCTEARTLALHFAICKPEGHQFIIADKENLPFAANSFDEAITNYVPIDIDTALGPGIQTSEVVRILKPGQRINIGKVHLSE